MSEQIFGRPEDVLGGQVSARCEIAGRCSRAWRGVWCMRRAREGRAEAGGVGATRAIERERRTQSLASRGTPGPGRRGHLYVEVTAMVVSGVGGGRG